MAYEEMEPVKQSFGFEVKEMRVELEVKKTEIMGGAKSMGICGKKETKKIKFRFS